MSAYCFKPIGKLPADVQSFIVFEGEIYYIVGDTIIKNTLAGESKNIFSSDSEIYRIFICQTYLIVCLADSLVSINLRTLTFCCFYKRFNFYNTIINNGIFLEDIDKIYFVNHETLAIAAEYDNVNCVFLGVTQKYIIQAKLNDDLHIVKKSNGEIIFENNCGNYLFVESDEHNIFIFYEFKITKIEIAADCACEVLFAESKERIKSAKIVRRDYLFVRCRDGKIIKFDIPAKAIAAEFAIQYEDFIISFGKYVVFSYARETYGIYDSEMCKYISFVRGRIYIERDQLYVRIGREIFELINFDEMNILANLRHLDSQFDGVNFCAAATFFCAIFGNINRQLWPQILLELARRQ